MKKVLVKSGIAPNGEKVWGIYYDADIVEDGTCGTSVEKKHLDKILPPTKTDQDYWLEVAKFACSMLEDKLKEKDFIFSLEFVCHNISYKKTK